MAASAPTVQPSGEPGSPAPRRLAAALRGGAWLRGAGLGGAIIPAFMLVFILIALLVKAWPAIQINGWSFFTKSVWQTGGYNAKTVTSHGITYLSGQDYGAVPQIVGTLQTSAIALIIAVPISVGAALLIVERLPAAVGRFVGIFLELLAGIPSVVIGLWGVLTFGPFLANDITPFIARNMPDVPVLNYFRGDTGSGEGLLTSGLILAIMIIPIIASTSRDLIRQVPILPREGAIALGMSDAECARRVTLPWVGSGIVGATVLGLGRALGETIAVAMVCGVRFGSIASNLYDTMVTVAANIIQNLDTVITDQRGLRTYAELALVLLVITLVVNVIARLLVKRVSGVSLPVGRGL